MSTLLPKKRWITPAHRSAFDAGGDHELLLFAPTLADSFGGTRAYAEATGAVRERSNFPLPPWMYIWSP
jgi:hypothetical protein